MGMMDEDESVATPRDVPTGDPVGTTDDGRPEQAPSLKQVDRQDAITELVLSSGSVKIKDIVSHFGVSRMTIHRDLDALEARGILRKSRGACSRHRPTIAYGSPSRRRTPLPDAPSSSSSRGRPSSSTTPQRVSISPGCCRRRPL